MHSQAWFFNQVRQDFQDKNPGWSGAKLDSAANAQKNESLQQIMTNANARCYLPGDPHLVAIERNGPYRDPITPGVNYVAAAWQRGGLDSTFTPDGVTGTWEVNTATPDSLIRRIRGIAGDAAKIGDARYLYPIDRLYNNGAKGLIHFNGNVGLSGTLNGRITLYANGSVILLDDIRYANDPVKGVCLEQSHLILVAPGHRVTAPAPRLVALLAADHDRRRVVARGLAGNEPLVPAGRVPADHADRVQLVHLFRDGEQLGHASERLAAEVRVGTREDHAAPARREHRGQLHHTGRKKLRLVDRHNLCIGRQLPCDLLR